MNNSIFITISRGGTARNILQNRFYDLLKKNFNEIYIFSPAYADFRFRNEFGDKNVFFEKLLEQKDTIFNRLLRSFYTYIIYNPTTARMSRYGVAGQEVPRWYYLKYILYKAFFLPLSKCKFVRKFLQKIDLFILQRGMVKFYLDKIDRYNPTVIFCTSIFEDEDIALLKAGKKRKIPVVAMPKTWDNISKSYFRAKADMVIVWGEFMEEQMIKYQDYDRGVIKRIGVPQFDYYVEGSALMTREEFCDLYGLNKDKKIILICSEGKISKHDPDVVRMLLHAIENGDLVCDSQILVRPHFAYKNDEDKFREFASLTNIIIDRNYKPSAGFKDQWDYSRDQMDRFLNILYHSDVTINTHSTLTLDAAALNKPTILIMFDGYTKKPYYRSVARWYTTDYYRKVLAFKPGRAVGSESELIHSVNLYLKNPNLDKDNRKKMLDYICGNIDGKAGDRLYYLIKNLIPRQKYEG